MSTTIYKFGIAITAVQTLLMQRGAKFLSAQVQDGLVCLWAELDPTAPLEDRVIEVFGTGHPIADADRTYIGTVQNGAYVWHIYELHHA